ncbi:MAG: tetratricopeptide repeat protein [Pyrinomonadaceae bacterium]
MLSKMRYLRFCFSAALITVFLIVPVSTTAQDLVPVSNITGSSVFVFRSASRVVRRVTPAVKPARTKAQRMESVTKIKKQYETLAKITPRRDKSKVVDPTKIPPRAERNLPPGQASILFAGVGEYYLEKGDFEQSFEFFKTAIRLDDTNTTAKSGYSEALATKGNDLLVKDQAATAKSIFLEAVKFNPKNSAAYFGLGEVYSELNETPEAIINYEKALQSDKDLTELYVPLGILYFQAGDIAKADDLLAKALMNSVGTAETQFFLGLVRTAQYRTDEALAAFQKAKELDPAYPEGFFNSGEVLVKLKRADDAIPDYQKAVELRPAYFDAWLGLAEAQYETGKYADAIASFQTASRLRNDNWQAMAGWGDAYLKTGKFNEAAAKLNLAATFLTRGKDFDKLLAADLYSKVGFAYGQQCEIDTANFRACQWGVAIKALEKAIELNGDPLDYTNLGWAYFNASRVEMNQKNIPEQQSKLALAKTALERVNSTNLVILDSAQQNLGAVLNDLGDFKGAIDVLKKVVDRHPDWMFSAYALGSAYAKVNDYGNAAKAFKTVADKGQGTYYIPALKSLGFVEIKRKNGKEVRRVIELLKKESPIDAFALEQQLKGLKL